VRFNNRPTKWTRPNPRPARGGLRRSPRVNFWTRASSRPKGSPDIVRARPAEVDRQSTAPTMLRCCRAALYLENFSSRFFFKHPPSTVALTQRRVDQRQMRESCTTTRCRCRMARAASSAATTDFLQRLPLQIQLNLPLAMRGPCQQIADHGAHAAAPRLDRRAVSNAPLDKFWCRERQGFRQAHQHRQRSA